MNSISWFLYCADVLESFGNIFGVFNCFLFLIAVILTACGIFIHATDYDRSKEGVKYWEQRRADCASWAKKLWTIFVLLTFILIAVPSKGTMYAIAASEVGERVAQSEAVKGIADDATKALRAWINKQIQPQEPKK